MIEMGKGADFITFWNERIKAGIDFQKKYSSYKDWDSYRKYYRGQWAEGVVAVNKIFSFGRSLIPRVYFRAPRVTVTATHPDMIWHARVVEEIDNTLIRETMLKETLKMSSLDSYISGTGPIKIGFDSEFGYMPEQAADIDGATVTQVSRKTGNKIEYRPNVKPGMPWAIRVRPEDVIVPWGTVDPYSMPWIGHYILRPLDDIRNDQKYKNNKYLKGTREPSGIGGQRSPFRPRSEQDKDVQFGELYEIRDWQTGRMYVFCENNLLLDVEDTLQVEGLPWEFIQFNPDPEFFWAIADCTIIEPQQKELNDVRTQASRHRKIALLKFLYAKGKVSQTELDKFLSNEVGIAVGIDDVENIANAVITLQPHIPPDLYREAMSIVSDMREELGNSQNQGGEFSPYHGKTATETMVVNQSFEERIDERRDIVADVLTRIVRKWNQIIFQRWSEERVIQITSPGGEPFWIKYTGEELKGEYFLNIDAESGMPITRPLKYQMGQELIKTFGGDQLIDQVLLRQIVLDNYSQLDPRIPRLLQTQFGGPAELLSAERQPGIMGGGAGGGKGAGGGRQGSSPQNPLEFEQAKKRFASGQGGQ